MKNNLIRQIQIVTQDNRYCSWRCPCLIHVNVKGSDHRCGANDEAVFKVGSEQYYRRTEECMEEAALPIDIPK